jgi:D-alanine-D-alanine ligase
MLVGLTYDLRRDYLARGYSEAEVAEFDSPETVEAIAAALKALGHRVATIGHLDNLVRRLAGGERWELVFNIAEGLNGYGREAQVPALLDYYRIPYTFSDPLALAVTLHKPTAKRLVSTLGLPTPRFAVVERTGQAEHLDLGWPVFAKPVAEGTGLGIDGASKAEGAEQLARLCARLISRHCQPVLVEEYLPGRELTVGLLGSGDRSRVIGVMEVSLRPEAKERTYSYLNKEQCEKFVRYRRLKGPLALAAGELALAAWRGLGCRDAGRVDLICGSDGKPQFLEANPLAGLHPTHSDLPILCGLAGVGYQRLIQGIMRSAAERLPSPVSREAAL